MRKRKNQTFCQICRTPTPEHEKCARSWPANPKLETVQWLNFFSNFPEPERSEPSDAAWRRDARATEGTQVMKLSFLIVLFSGVTAFGGDSCPSSQEIIRTWNWGRIDSKYINRQYQRLSDAIDRENLQRRLDSFLLNQGY